MISLIALFVFELVIIRGDEYSVAYEFQLLATKVMDQGVEQYQQRGLLDLQHAQFSVRLYLDNTTIIELQKHSRFVNPDGSWRNYTELHFTSCDYVSTTTK